MQSAICRVGRDRKVEATSSGCNWRKNPHSNSRTGVEGERVIQAHDMRSSRTQCEWMKARSVHDDVAYYWVIQLEAADAEVCYRLDQARVTPHVRRLQDHRGVVDAGVE